jgi:hypothetical protein
MLRRPLDDGPRGRAAFALVVPRPPDRDTVGHVFRVVGTVLAEVAQCVGMVNTVIE